MPDGLDLGTETVISVGGGSGSGQAALIPNARIINNVDNADEWDPADNCFPGMLKLSAPRRYKFILEWGQRPDSMTDANVIARLNEVMATWEEYAVLMEARPHLESAPPGSEFEVADVTVPKRFKNDVVFQRYWPEGVGLWTLDDWETNTTILDARQTQYALAKQYFETMMTAIQDSPYDAV